MYQYFDLSNHLHIPMYNLMIGIGILFGALVLERQIKNMNLKCDIEMDLYIGIALSVIAAFLGSKLFYLLYSKQDISLNNIINGGMTYYGGFVCAATALILYYVIRQRKILFMLNTIVPSLVIAHAFGRIGCFLGGCCFGKPTNTLIGVNFPDGSIPFNHYGEDIKIYPVQLFESIFLFILFAIITKVVKFDKNLIAYLILYGFFRFFIEYFRGDNRGTLFTNLLSPSQIISILFVILGILLYAMSTKKKNMSP
ncbi:MAG: prolipoprotein diacylglyceryl transferase [Campylobacteraceae bacterium]|jgi:phosphatidylglycerol:prolipoprotein diacylglycerol transferase|nr:prolipoprotein diacylglyceryl transferase [Campylobacteraceae bacterium]